MTNQITYTDAHINSYTKHWVNTRLNKRRYIVKNGLINTGGLLFSQLVVDIYYKHDVTILSVLGVILIAALIGFGGAVWTFSGTEKAYQKFLSYQETRQLADPKPGFYYN